MLQKGIVGDIHIKTNLLARLIMSDRERDVVSGKENKLRMGVSQLPSSGKEDWKMEVQYFWLGTW